MHPNPEGPDRKVITVNELHGNKRCRHFIFRIYSGTYPNSNEKSFPEWVGVNCVSAWHTLPQDYFKNDFRLSFFIQPDTDFLPQHHQL